MLEIESSNNTFAVSGNTMELNNSLEQNTLQRTGLNVPRDVAHKYDVEDVHQTVEELIQQKLNDQLSQAQRENEEAFYFIDLGTVVRKYKEWITNLPRVHPFFAIKCNPNTAIIKTLASFGVNFDCASKSEIQQILGCGVDPTRIIYANPCKMKNHITYAKSMGVEMMTFDNKDELLKIAECYPDAKLVLRIITDDSHSICRFSTKFGAPLDMCEDLIRTAKQMNLNLIGISFHVGSGCMSVQSFETAIRSAHGLFQFAETVGYQFNFLDLGGGWPGTDYDVPITFTDISAAIRPLLDELFSPDVQIIAEPGRYFVAESHTLAVNVFAKRAVENALTGEKHFLYYINDGVYQSFNCIFFDHVHPKPLVFQPGNRTDVFKCTIFGPTCDSMDCIAKDIMLQELEVGEWLYFKNMGAYTVAAASPFNGFKSCPTTYYINTPLPADE
jgi:ornithine decarboxylase